MINGGWHKSGPNCAKSGFLDRRAIVGALALAVCLSYSARSEACSPGWGSCYDAGAHPGGGTVPANLAAILVGFSTVGQEAKEARLVRIDGSQSVAVATTFEPGESEWSGFLRLDEPLAPGGRYAVEMLDCGDVAPSAIAELDAGPTAALPTALGTIRTTEPATGEIGLFAGGSLSCGRQAQGELFEASVELDENALPWIEALNFWATIDGERWFDETYGWVGGTPPPGYGGTRIYRLCDEMSLGSGQQLAAGPHELVIHAKVEGTDIELATESITVALYCEGERQGGLAADLPDVAAPEPELQPGVTAPEPELQPAGGGCSAVPKRRQLSLPLLAIAGLMVCLRRRKRRG